MNNAMFAEMLGGWEVLIVLLVTVVGSPIAIALLVIWLVRRSNAKTSFNPTVQPAPQKDPTSVAPSSSTCPRCGTTLPADSPQGLCPRCVMGVGLATQTEATGEFGPHGTKVTKPPPSPADIAKNFPQLEILDCLGRGGMGVVYKARQPKLNRLVALKILAPEKGADPKFAERFLREAQALARLSHPNIVTVHDFGEADGMFYLLMEYVDGATLRQLLREGRMKPETALTIVPRICEALQFAHEQGVVHRDIKPENVLLDKQGRVKIADFGIAKIVGEAGRAGSPLPAEDAQPEGGAPGVTRPTVHLTQDQVLGTPHYMAPEQVEHPQTVDHRADIYSLGVVFYEMLTGELPLGKFQPPSKKVQVDVRLDEVVLHALEKEPERRYQHVSEVKSDVETIATTPSSSSSGRQSAPSVDQSRLTSAATVRSVVKGPATALFIVGCLNFGLVFAMLVHNLFLAGHDGRPPASFAMVPAILLLAGYGVTVIGASRMRLLSSYGWAMTATLCAMFLPIGCIIGLPLGIWSLVVLCRREVREAFEANRLGMTPLGSRQAAASVNESDLAKARQEVKNPASWLVATGILNWIAIPFIVMVVLPFASRSDAGAGPALFAGAGPALLALVAALFLSSAMILAGLKMRRLEAYSLAVIGSFLAIFITPGNIIGLPVGIWCLVALFRRDVREAFRKTYLLPSEGGQLKQGGGAWKVATAILIPLAFAVAVLLMVIAIPVWSRVSQPRYVLTGTVTDAATGKSIAGAHVTDNRYGATATQGPQDAWTDANGDYTLRTWPEEHTITVYAPGFESGTATLTTSLWGRERTARMDFQLQPTNTSVALSFGPMIERVVNDDGAKQDFFIDLDTGKLFTPPQGLNPSETNAFAAWLRTNGIDAMGETSVSVRGLVGMEMIVRPLAGPQWESLKPQDALANEVLKQGTPGSPVFLSAKGELPETFLFKTREGGVGILQITGIIKGGAYAQRIRVLGGVKIRYKLVQSGETNPQINSVFDAAVAPPGAFSKKLPSGIIVKLDGVSEHPSKGRSWWRPDGSPRDVPPYDRQSGNVYPGRDAVAREITVLLEDLPHEDVSTEWNFEPAVSSAGGGAPWKSEVLITNRRAIAITVPANAKTLTVRLGVGVGPWKDIAATSAKGMSTINHPNGAIMFSRSIEENGALAITVTHNRPGEWQLIARDRSGHEHTSTRASTSSAGSQHQITATFPKLSPQDVREFVLQSRTREWVEFRNVALNAKLATSSADTSAFGPVIERVLTNECAMDLDTGRHAELLEFKTAKEGLDGINEKVAAIATWMEQQGMDALFADEFTAYGMKVKALKVEDWSKLSPSQLGEVIRTIDPKSLPQVLLDPSTAPYAFQTREGRQGILQVLDNENPRSVKIRYKLVLADTRPANTNRPAARQTSPPARLLTSGEFGQDFQMLFPLTPKGRFSLDNPNGSVEITGWDGNQVLIKGVKRGKKQEVVEATTIDVESGADHVTVLTRVPRKLVGWGNENVTVDYIIQVPRAARVQKIENANGDVLIKDIIGDIEASTANGSVRAKGSAGDLKLATANGQIAAEPATLGGRQSVTLDAANGSITVTLPADADATVTAETSNGSIRSEFPELAVKKGFPNGSQLKGTLGQGGASIKAQLANGKITIQRGK